MFAPSTRLAHPIDWSHHLHRGKGAKCDLLGKFRTWWAACLDDGLQRLSWLQWQESSGGGQFAQTLRETAARRCCCCCRCCSCPTVMLQSSAVEDIDAIVRAINLCRGRWIHGQTSGTTHVGAICVCTPNCCCCCCCCSRWRDISAKEKYTVRNQGISQSLVCAWR